MNLVDPAWVQPLLELPDRTEILACYEDSIIVQYEIDLGIFEFTRCLAIIRRRILKLALEDEQILVLKMKRRIKFPLIKLSDPGISPPANPTSAYPAKCHFVSGVSLGLVLSEIRSV